MLEVLSKPDTHGELEENFEFENFIKSIKKDLKKYKSLIEQLDNHHEPTLKHSIMVAQDSVYIGQKLGLSSKALDDLRVAALLHDVGKLFIHDSILDLGNLSEMSEIWRYNYPDKNPPRNLFLALTVRNVMKYKASKEKDQYSHMEKNLKWMEDNDVISFLNQPLKKYMEFHQRGTEIILSQRNLTPRVVSLAASHHPNYFNQFQKNKLLPEAKIIEIADKFNALIHSEGFRSYSNKKTRLEALGIIAEELKEIYIGGFFKSNKLEKEIIGLLLKKYGEDQLKSEILPQVKIVLKKDKLNQEDINIIHSLKKQLAISLMLSDDFYSFIESEFKKELEKIKINLEMIVKPKIKV